MYRLLLLQVLDRDETIEEEDPGKPDPPRRLSSEPAASWMEIEWPGSDDDEALEEGDQVTLSIRLRQSEGRDAAVGTCLAFDEDGDDDSPSLRLTDAAGCSVSPDLIPHLAATFNSRTGVKALRTSFPAFRPSSSQSGGRLSVRCQVLVCRGNCPVARCGGQKKDALGGQEEAKGRSVIDSYWLQTHVEVSERAGPKKHPPRKAVAKARTALIEEEVGEKISEEEMLEADEAYLEQELFRHQAEASNLVCVSPPRLLVAFSVLLLVLLLALVCACLLWARARGATSSAPSAGSAGRFLRVKRASAQMPPPPPPLPGPRRPLPPIMMQQRGMPPYIRVMH